MVQASNDTGATREDLRGWRLRHKLLGKDVADLLGYSPSYISRCERGHHPLSDTAWRVLRAAVGEEDLGAGFSAGRRAAK